MAANLLAPKITGRIDYKFLKSATIYDLSTGAVNSTFTLSPLITIANSGIAKTVTIAASGTLTLTLTTDLDPLGDAVTATKAMALFVKVTATTTAGGILTIAPGASNGLVWFWSGTTPVITVPVNGMVMFAEPTGVTIDATHKTILLTNTGTQSIDVEIVILCKQ